MSLIREYEDAKRDARALFDMARQCRQSGISCLALLIEARAMGVKARELRADIGGSWPPEGSLAAMEGEGR